MSGAFAYLRLGMLLLVDVRRVAVDGHARYRTDRAIGIFDNTAMPRYSFSLGYGARIPDSDATEDLPDNHAAMESAKLIAKDLAQSKAAQDRLNVVVRDEADKEVGAVPIRHRE